MELVEESRLTRLVLKRAAMEAALEEVGLGYLWHNVRANKISLEEAKKLTDEELSALGVNTIGDRVRLKEKLKESGEEKERTEANNDMQRDVVSLFRPRRSGKQLGRKSKPLRTFTGNFFCFSGNKSDKCPSSTEKSFLQKNGLGSKRIQLLLSDNAESVTQKLKKEYPQLESIGGFELLRCLPNCRHLEVLDCNWDTLSLKTNVGGQAKIYIRPIQKNIATDNVDRIPKEDTYEECTRCSTLIKIRDLRSHLENCNAGNREVHYLVMENFAPQQDTFSSVILPHEQQPDIPTPLSLSGASNVFEPQVTMTLPNDASLDESFTVDNSRDVMETSDFSEVSRAVIECKTFCEANNICDPTNILKIFQGLMVTGRPLDLDETSLTTGISGETNFIMIDRNDVIRTSFDEINDIPDLRKCLEVKFYGKTAVDYGGPRKEFFCLILQTLQTEYFDPVKEWCNNDEIIGKIMALSTLQNGRLPRLLTAEMVQEVFFSDSERPCVFDLRKGLDSLGLIQLTREMPSFIHLFTPKEPTPVTVKMVTQLMEPHFSEEGSNRRTLESAIYSRFIKYIREAASGRRQPVTLGKVLKFVTGTEEEPVLGFSLKPSIHFSENQSFLPSANTCINRLNLNIPSEIAAISNDTELFNLYDYAFSNDYFGLQ